MDTYRFNTNAESMIEIMEDSINNESESNAKIDKYEIYSTLLRLNRFSSLFLKKNSLPEIEYPLFTDEMITEDGRIDNSRYFKPVEYQFNLLMFLFLNYEKFKDFELRILIEEFIERIKNFLKIQDIQLTKTGAVRCKTNIRFAIMSLRNYGLINYKDANMKRNWSPTLLGFFVCILFILKNHNKVEDISLFEIKYLDPFTAHLKVNFLDTKILEMIRELNIESNFENVINTINVKHQTFKFNKEFVKLIKDYSDLINAFYLDNISKREFDKKIKELLIKEENNIEKFKEELIKNSNQYILVKRAYEIINNKQI